MADTFNGSADMLAVVVTQVLAAGAREFEVEYVDHTGGHNQRSTGEGRLGAGGHPRAAQV